MTRLGGFGVPGNAAIDQTTEAEILWGGDAAKGLAVWKSGVISGAARDAGASPTTILRPGLVLGKITASGKYKEYLATATDGSQVAECILGTELRAQDFNANNADRVFRILCAGNVKAGKLNGLDQYARGHLANRFLFDDSLMGNRTVWPRVVAKTSDYTVTAADNNTLFTNQGASASVTFTLPTLDRGLRYGFYAEADQHLIVASATADTIVTFNDAAADTVYWGTASEIIGGMFEVVPNADETKWLFMTHLAMDSQTPIITT